MATRDCDSDHECDSSSRSSNPDTDTVNIAIRSSRYQHYIRMRMSYDVFAKTRVNARESAHARQPMHSALRDAPVALDKSRARTR